MMFFDSKKYYVNKTIVSTQECENLILFKDRKLKYQTQKLGTKIHTILKLIKSLNDDLVIKF